MCGPNFQESLSKCLKMQFCVCCSGGTGGVLLSVEVWLEVMLC